MVRGIRSTKVATRPRGVRCRSERRAKARGTRSKSYPMAEARRSNLFIFLDVNGLKVKVTDSRTAVDFAACMQELVGAHFLKAERIHVVFDNLSTHSVGALYQAFPPDEARRLLRRLEFHYVPKHASWLNMVEIEIGVLRCQCLDRRIDNPQHLRSEIAAWDRHRNTSRARIKWMFTTAKARTKIGRAYPNSQPKSQNHCDEVLATNAR